MIVPSLREVATWLRAHRTAPSGAPLIRYLTVDMPNRLVVDVGYPVTLPIQGDGRVRFETLPAGFYVSYLYVGAPEGLARANADLQAWADKRGIQWKTDGNDWSGRAEFYYSNPRQQPDTSKWRTEILYLTK